MNPRYNPRPSHKKTEVPYSNPSLSLSLCLAIRFDSCSSYMPLCTVISFCACFFLCVAMAGLCWCNRWSVLEATSLIRFLGNSASERTERLWLPCQPRLRHPFSSHPSLSLRYHNSSVMHTRFHTLVDAAAAAAESSPPEGPILPLFSIDELEQSHGDINALIQLFVDRKMLLDPNRDCPQHHKPMVLHRSKSHLDGLSVRCNICKSDKSLRLGSAFTHIHAPLIEVGRLLCYFDARLTVTLAVRLSRETTDTVSALWKMIRMRMDQYLKEHPIKFKPTDIVEIDELYLKPLRPDLNEFKERPAWKPIIGSIARGGGPVALDICDSHSTRDIMPSIMSHLPSHDTTVITDEHRSFTFLNREVLHEWCHKERRGSAAWPVTHMAETHDSRPYTVHTNTIEGYWSDLRLHLHASHGWTADYLPLFLSECMFRSLHIPITTLLRASI